MRRRDFLKSALILAGAPLSIPAARPLHGSALPARAQQFDYDWLKNHARRIASSDYKAPDQVLPHPLTQLDYNAYQAIRFGAHRALWLKDNLAFRVEFFHRGPMFKEQVRMHEIVDDQASAILYDPAMFDFRRARVDVGSCREISALPASACIFIPIGAPMSQLFSARATSAPSAATIASTACRPAGWPSTRLDKGEEFPRFTDFLARAAGADAGTLTVYALMDSPSVAGAYRFRHYSGRTLDDGCRCRALSAQGHRAAGHRAADQHVPARRERPPHGQRLAPGDP